MRDPLPSGGSAPPLLYDASRLCTRVLNPTPNGIDRLDAMLARGLLDATGTALVFGRGRPRLLPAGRVLAAVDRVERGWREGPHGTADDAAILSLAAALGTHRPGRAEPPIPPGGGRQGLGRLRRLAGGLRTLASLGLWGGPDPAEAAARGAVYLNASHFPLEWPSHVAWLARRRDVRPVMLVHDLLPFDHPDWFWAGEPERHRARLRWLAERGAGAIVTSLAVEDRLRTEMARAGRRDLPVLRAAPPVAPAFRIARRRDPCLAGARYFVACGTIEPRKNHALLLRLWRRLAAERGTATPKLVVVGKPGWRCDDLLREMRVLARERHLVLARGLSSGAYRRLLDGSLALLAPSWAEGYGLPLAEARARGVPAIASDIAPFREQRPDMLIDPRAERAWFDAIMALAGADPPSTRRAVSRDLPDEGRYLGAVRAFLDALP